MDVHTDIPLKNFTTLRLGGSARFFADAHTLQELTQVYQNAEAQHTPVFILGGGSNVVARDEGFNGLIVRVRLLGIAVIADDLYATTLKIGAGEQWDAVVKHAIDMHLSGIEALSGIPGTAGAAPVQNIGAYGQEIADTLVSLEAYDTTTHRVVTLQAAECEFSYRHSIFRGSQQGRYIITSIILKLSKSPPTPPFYEALQTYFDTHLITAYTSQIVRDAVLAIRTDKLPDPAVKPNAGSFFKNTIIEGWQLPDLQTRFPSIKYYEMADDHIKIPTGWLIETAGFKGQLLHGIRVHDKNCLVLINESAKGYADLAAARDEIIGKVRDLFQVTIEQEPLEIA